MKKSVFFAGMILAGLMFLNNKPYVGAEPNISQEPNEEIVVEVQKGDSLSKIATAHTTTYTRLFDANEFIEHPDVIHPGEKVRIPNENEELPARNIEIKADKQINKKTGNAIKPKIKPVNKDSKAVNNSADISQADNISSGDIWDALARCESGGNWSINTGNGYYGGLQFSAATWRSVGGSGLPHQNSREEQITRGKILQARSGWGQWPACTRKLGLR